MEPRPEIDSGSELLVHESMEDNGGITNGSVSEKLENISESDSHNNGVVVVENGDNGELLPNWKQKGHEILGSIILNSTPVDVRLEQSESGGRIKKGVGLRKWRRIKRDPNKGGDSITDPGRMVTRDLPDSGASSSKRMLINGEHKQKSEGSVSSTNAVIGRLGDFAPLDDSGFGLVLPFNAGADSESSEHQSSRSSTAASAPNKNRMRFLSGKNWANLVEHGQQGIVRIETMKKENSRSSIESDSRSSNFMFMHGAYSTNNGICDEQLKHSNGENGDEAQGSQRNISDGHQVRYGRNDGGEYDDFTPKDVIADSSWEVKEDINQNSSSRDLNTLVESIFALQSAQDALEKEVQKFKDVGKDISVDDPASDLYTQFMDVRQEVQITTSNHLPYGVSVNSSTQAKQFNNIGDANRGMETELEDLFKQKIEVEVEYLVISTMLKKLRVAPDNQITVLEGQKTLASEQTRLPDKLGNPEKKAPTQNKGAENSHDVYEDIGRANEILNLQKTAWKYSLCVLVQLALLVAIITVFISRISADYVVPVPT